MVWSWNCSNINTSGVVWVEICELGLVETKKDGGVPKRTRTQGNLLQVLVWRHERDGEDDKRCQKIWTHQSFKRYRFSNQTFRL